MWPFFHRQKQRNSQLRANSQDHSAKRRLLKFAEIIQGMGDFSDLQNHDVALKFWLPEAANEALKELSAMDGESMSEMLRRFFAQHCYGVYAFQVMNEAIPGLFKDPLPVMFMRSVEEDPPGKKRVVTYWVPELGKNVMPVKVWVAQRMRQDLQILADHAAIKLSQYAREIVISRLLGHGTLPKRPEMLVAAPLPSADDWCEDRDVPNREVGREEYLEHDECEIKIEWVDVDT